ncbi:MAG: hypothetical protein GYA55_00545 [SAR324 cluster bacterium]|uniref:Uncharacterized protein n=1 Tax=SAR324 cluster bacterium TaxID=2024889 RepID=A0A7X9II35_9DELT|nr:hypothetical protein [SAR324 cluster bacterium]
MDNNEKHSNAPEKDAYEVEGVKRVLDRESSGPSAQRGEMSAAALGRILGLATVNDLNIMEGKIDLLTSKLNQLIMKMEKVLNFTTKAPTGADLERIDVQVGALKAAIQDFIAKNSNEQITPGRVGHVSQPRETAKAIVPETQSSEEKPAEQPHKKVTLSSLNT